MRTGGVRYTAGVSRNVGRDCCSDARRAHHPFGNVKADVLADKDPKFQRMKFFNFIRGSQWKG
jgi:hypothetical protein